MMSYRNRSSNDNRAGGSGGDPLDDLLAQATWPDPPAESTCRLEATWDELRRPAPPWRNPAATAAIAAAILLCTGVAWMILARPRPRPALANSPSPPARAVVSPPLDSTPRPPAALIALVDERRVHIVRADAPAPVVGREPTVRELALLRRRDRRPPPPAQSGQPAASDPDALAAVVVVSPDAEAVPRFCAAARPEHFPLVRKLFNDPRTRPAALEAMARLADAATLARTARETNAPAHRRRLIAALLHRSDQQSLEPFLELLADVSTRADALAALDVVTDPPIDPLFATLDRPRGDLRRAAALALGRINGPVVTRRLIERVAADQGRGDAFLALASSKGRDAQQFLREATASERLSSWAKSAIAQAQVR